MSSLHAIGAGLGHLALSAARRPAGDRRVQAVVTEALPGPAVWCRPGGDLLPVSFTSARTASEGDLEWLTTILTQLRTGWLASLTPGERRHALAVPSGMPPAERVRCREAARRAGWEGVRVVGNDMAVPRAHFADITDPATCLIAEIGFDETVLSLATILGGTVRLRGRLRLPWISHRHLDERILAGCLEAGGIRGAEGMNAGDWPAMWLDASRVRRELEGSAAAAVDLTAPGWGQGARLVAVSREDLWPLFRPEVESVATAAGELRERCLGPRERLGSVLVLGGGVLSWPPAREILASRLDATTEAVPVQAPAVGAALLAVEPEDPFAVGIDHLDPQWTRAWEIRRPRSFDTRGVPGLRVESAAPPATHPPAETYERHLEGVWSYLRGVASENPGRARQLLEALREQALGILATLEPEAEGDPDLERAERLLGEGRLDAALDASHVAFSRRPNDPAVFRRMIEVHVQAALAEPNHEQALCWLRCAHGHDQANGAIHRHLAQRYREQAGDLAREGQSVGALEAVRQSLMFAPLDADARALEARLVHTVGESGRW